MNEPYVFGGGEPSAPFDCSELVERVTEQAASTVEFDYVLRDDLETMERYAEIGARTGVPIVEDLADKIMRHDNPFFEVTLRCSLDTTTGKITILGVKQS